MKRTAMNHTKMRRLCRALKVPQYAAAGILECLWHLAAREAPAGDIGKLSDEDIAEALGWDRVAAELTAGLLTAEWLDEHPEHRLVIHDWHEHSEDAVDNMLARAHQRYADGHTPRMSRLGKQERDRLMLFYEIPESQARTHRAHGERTESHKKPLPLPSPKPSLSPAFPDAVLPVETSPVLGLPVVRIAVPMKLGSGDVQREVLMRAGLSGQNLSRNVSEVAEAEFRKGRDAMELIEAMADALNAYSDAKRAGKLTQYAPKPEGFIGNGMWRDPKLWPWKEGHGPPKPQSIHDPLTEINAQRAKAQEERDRTGNS